MSAEFVELAMKATRVRMDLAGLAAHALLVLAARSDEQGVAECTIKSLSAECGWSKNAIVKALNTLEESGLIARENPKPGRYHYSALIRYHLRRDALDAKPQQLDLPEPATQPETAIMGQEADRPREPASLADWFAGQALVGLLAGVSDGGSFHPGGAAQAAYEYADALMAQRLARQVTGVGA